MSCGLPLEFFEDESARVQPLNDALAQQGDMSYLGQSREAAPWVDALTQGGHHVEIVRPVVNHGSFVYWVKVATDSGPRLPQRHYLITWRVWFELRRLGMV
ncbi:MAG: hypothetical protein GXX83_05370 [Gaiellales bacterium]|nr:hypothetical protein [Gaiellales bacterium]